MVYVLSKESKPLMPCENVVARLLLKEKKAKVKRKVPFTIQLQYDSTEYTQKCVHGVDTGSGTVGSAVVSEGKVIYVSEIEIRNDITAKMTQRNKYRRNRRNRKTRYRKKRFDNRGNSKRIDRFSPTVNSKIQSHERVIEFVKSILPITDLVLETGTFDMHYMKNPSLRNEKKIHWGYQKGVNYGFANSKEMVLSRDNYTCKCCKSKKGTMEVHHIVYRSNGGSDDAENLVTLCEKCHKELHKGLFKEFEGKLVGIKKGTLKHATQMNSIRKQLFLKHPNAIETFGYVTKENRQLLGIEKTHYTDACVIASGGEPVKFKTNYVYVKKDIAKRDIQRTKGIRSEQMIPIGKIQGFRKFDKVEYLGKEYFIKGRMSSGYAILMDIHGVKVDFSNMPKGFKTPKLKNLIRKAARKCQMITTEKIIPSLV